MKVAPKIMGSKSKSVRIDPDELAEFRKNLKANPKWAKYATCTDSELVRLALIFGNIRVDTRVVTMPLMDAGKLIHDAVTSNIAKVAAALGAVAQMNHDGTISVSHPDLDSIKTFEAEMPTPDQPTASQSTLLN